MNAISFHSLLTLVFFVTFIGMVFWVYWPARKGTYDNAAQLPFAADNKDRIKEDGEDNRHE